MLVTDPERLNSVLLGFTVISAMRRLYPEEFEIESVIGLLGNAEALNCLKAGQAPAEVLRHGQAQMREFLAKRKNVLIYD